MSYRERRLYRSIDERTIAGVASGFAEYFGVSVIVVRVAFIFLIFTGIGFPLYMLFWLLTPRDPADGYSDRTPASMLVYIPAAFAAIIGAALIVRATGHAWSILPFIFGLGIGMFFFVRARRSDEDGDRATRGMQYPERNESEVDEAEAKIAGVCLRLARLFGIDPVIVRVVSVILIPITFPLVPILYVIAALVMPKSTGAVPR